MFNKYKLIHRDTGEVATYGDDNAIVFGGPWGAVDEQGNPYYIWAENTISPEEIQAQQLAALDTEYQAQFTELAQALGLANLDNNTELIAELQEEYAELKAEYQAEREAIINGNN